MAGTIYIPHGEEGYERLVSFLDNLIDEVGEDESHPLASLMEIVGILIERYEDEYVPELSALSRNPNRPRHEFIPAYTQRFAFGFFARRDF